MRHLCGQLAGVAEPVRAVHEVRDLRLLNAVQRRQAALRHRNLSRNDTWTLQPPPPMGDQSTLLITSMVPSATALSRQLQGSKLREHNTSDGAQQLGAAQYDLHVL